MNIDLFIEARKKSGLSQSELAEGICTQTTLSRFENNGQIPNLKILTKLCERLGLSLSTLFPKVSVKHSELIEKMNKAEFYLITSEYQLAKDLLNTINVTELQDELLVLRYRYLQGFIMIFQEASIMDILFNFDQILLEETTRESEIFKLLAYTGIGVVFSREGDLEKSEFYFSKVLEKIYSFPAKSMEDTWRVLHIMFQCGVFYAEIKEYSVSDALLGHAINICSDNHVTYYLARAAIQLAKNAISQEMEENVILELIYDARAYAKINRNEIGLALLKKMEASILS